MILTFHWPQITVMIHCDSYPHNYCKFFDKYLSRNQVYGLSKKWTSYHKRFSNVHGMNQEPIRNLYKLYSVKFLLLLRSNRRRVYGCNHQYILQELYLRKLNFKGGNKWYYQRRLAYHGYIFLAKINNLISHVLTYGFTVCFITVISTVVITVT